MKRILKWAGLVLGGLLFILLCILLLVNVSYNRRLNRTYDVKPVKLTLPKDSLSLVEGKKWVNNLCTPCHSDQLEGKKFLNDPSIGTLIAPNLTPVGVARDYADADWVRAIRHGVGLGGRPLLIMPANEFHSLSEEHLGQIIAYLKTIPPVKQDWEASKFTLLAKILLQTGAFGKVIPAEYLDHNAKLKASPTKKDRRVYGAYLVQISGCRSCHGPQLNGAPNHDPNGPPGVNITPAGNLAKWGETGFVQTIRTGVTPEGKKLDQKFMPWQNISQQDDEGLKAIYAYLMAQPKLETPKDLAKVE